MLFSDKFSEVETCIWEDHIELDYSLFYIINGGILYLLGVYCFYKTPAITTLIKIIERTYTKTETLPVGQIQLVARAIWSVAFSGVFGNEVMNGFSSFRWDSVLGKVRSLDWPTEHIQNVIISLDVCRKINILYEETHSRIITNKVIVCCRGDIWPPLLFANVKLFHFYCCIVIILGSPSPYLL